MNPGNKLKNVLCSLDTIVASIVLAILIISPLQAFPSVIFLGAPLPGWRKSSWPAWLGSCLPQPALPSGRAIRWPLR